MEKINVAELLEDCPLGMELDCSMFINPVYLNEVRIGEKYSITIESEKGNIMTLTDYGTYADIEEAKCVIFPKGKTTWEGFVPPIGFKDGDVVVTEDDESFQLFLLKRLTHSEDNNNHYGDCYFGCDVSCGGFRLFEEGNWGFNRLATKEEKQKLFDTIKANGYRWNFVTKTLEKLLPKFKVGDRIRHKIANKDDIYEIGKVYDDCYGLVGFTWMIYMRYQDQYELVPAPNKFDINTLVPFESKVLVRNSGSGFWKPAFWGTYEAERSNEHQYRNYLTTEGFVRHCIPYNDETKHLVGKTCDCPEYYKTWQV